MFVRSYLGTGVGGKILYAEYRVEKCVILFLFVRLRAHSRRFSPESNVSSFLFSSPSRTERRKRSGVSVVNQIIIQQKCSFKIRTMRGIYLMRKSS
jgi:hypothetical protein